MKKLSIIKNLCSLLMIAPLPLHAVSSVLEYRPVDSPDGWSIVSQNPCDSFIVFQNNQIRDSNFIYYLVTEHETIALSDISDVITEKMKCLNPETKKSGIGALQITCSNDMIINVWESNANYQGQDTFIYSSIILKNMSKEIIKHELPKLVQTSMIYQDLVLKANFGGYCSDKAGSVTENADKKGSVGK